MTPLTYVFLTQAEAESIDFNDVFETSSNSLRWNIDQTETLVKFRGATPSWLEDKTTYTPAELGEQLALRGF